MDIIPSIAPKCLTSDRKISNYLLIVDAYSKIPKLYGMEKISTEEVMDKMDIFQSRSGNIGKCGWWDLERISADAGSQFTSTKFKEECQTSGVNLTLAAPEHHEMNRQVEVTWIMLYIISHPHMVHARVSEAYIHFELIYTTDHIFTVLLIKYLMNKDDKPTTSFKLTTGTKPLVSYLRVLFCP